MRALTGQALKVAGLGDRASWPRVKIDRGVGDWVDLTALEGRNWIDSVEYSESEDEQVAEARIKLVREDELLSLATLMDTSKLNASGTIVDVDRPVIIEGAVVPSGMVPSASDWMEVFRGRILSTDEAHSPFDIVCRSKLGDLADAWVETQKVYGSDAGVAVETVIQQILDDAFTNGWVAEHWILYSPNGTGGTPFNVGDSPGWLLHKYKQGKESILDAITKLARQIGWVIRYRWQTSTAAFQLQLFEPDRPVRARGTLTLTGQPTAAQTFLINATTCTARAAGAVTNEFNIGSTVSATCDNIVAMLLAGAEKLNLYAWRVNQTVVIEWRASGVAGNAVPFTEALSNTTADGGGFLGGTQLGGSPAIDYTFGPSTYFDVERLAMTGEEIRNAVKVTYSDMASGLRTTIVREDAASIARYRRRPMEITEDGASEIDSVVEAADFANAALDDLKEPLSDKEIRTPYFPWSQTGDYYRFSANGRHFSSDQDRGIYAVRHTLMASGAGETSVSGRGKPSGGTKRWLEIEGRPGVAPAVDLYADTAPTGVTVTPAVGGFAVEYDDPATMDPPVLDWSVTECHAKLGTLDFSPDASTLVGIGQVTRFEIGGLVPGASYTVKLRIIDFAGNVTSSSAFVLTAAQRVGPYHTNGDQEFGALNQNPSFGCHTLDETANPMDAWSVDAASAAIGWGSAAEKFYFDAATQLTGGRSLRFNQTPRPGAGTKTYRFQGDLFVVESGALLYLAWSFRHDGNGAGDNKIGFFPAINYYDASKALITGGTPNGTINPYDTAGLGQTFTANTWYSDRAWQTVGATARFAQLVVGIRINAAFPTANHPVVLVDAYACSRSLEKMGMGSLSGGTDRTIATATWVPPWLERGAQIDTAGGFTPGAAAIPIEHQYVAQRRRRVAISGRVALTATLGAGNLLQARILKNGTELIAGPAVQDPPTGNPKADVTIGDVEVQAGDVFKLQGYQNSGVNKTIDDSECLLQFTEITEAQR